MHPVCPTLKVVGASCSRSFAALELEAPAPLKMTDNFCDRTRPVPCFGLTGDDTLPLADPDEDGVRNFEEMAFNLNPNSADANQITNLATATAGLPRLHRRGLRRSWTLG